MLRGVPEVSRSAPEGCAESRSRGSVASKACCAETLRRKPVARKRCVESVLRRSVASCRGRGFRGRSCKASGGPSLTAKLRRTPYGKIYIR